MFTVILKTASNKNVLYSKNTNKRVNKRQEQQQQQKNNDKHIFKTPASIFMQINGTCP